MYVVTIVSSKRSHVAYNNTNLYFREILKFDTMAEVREWAARNNMVYTFALALETSPLFLCEHQDGSPLTDAEERNLLTVASEDEHVRRNREAKAAIIRAVR